MRRPRLRGTKRRLFHAAVRFLEALSRVLPRRAALAVFAGIAEAVRFVDRPAVRRSLENLERGNAVALSRRNAVVRGMFRATGRNLVDLFRLSRNNPAELRELVRFEGLDHLDAALARGRGVVLLSGHLGNWEVLAAALAARGYPLSILARRLFDPRSDRLLNAWRTSCGVRVIARDGGLLPAARAIRRGEVVGTLVDQDSAGPAIFSEFFGRPARTAVAPFALARRLGAAIVPVWIHLDEKGTHRACVAEELPLPEGDPEQALAAEVRAWHAVLEGAIRSCPEQWVWHHRRWRSQPPPEGAADLRSLSKAYRYVAQFQRSTGAAIAR